MDGRSNRPANSVGCSGSEKRSEKNLRNTGTKRRPTGVRQELPFSLLQLDPLGHTVERGGEQERSGERERERETGAGA